MKLRNKKTGKIIDPMIHTLGGKEYNSLAELNEEWKDYEEPKEFYFITEIGEVYSTIGYGDDGLYKEIGNYFETKEQAEKAVEKLTAWKRLKDKGFVFKGVNEINGNIKTGLTKGVSFSQCEEFYDDMNLVFGDEE